MTLGRTAADDQRIVQGGRAKAYRPLPAAERRRAIAAGLAAYEHGDFFEAHELLEPAWMGTRDVAQRDAIQGLIKLAAAYVHAVRGNPAGVAKNLDGARVRLARATEAAARPAVPGVDLPTVIASIDDRRRRLATLHATAASSGSRVRGSGLDLLALVPPPALRRDR